MYVCSLSNPSLCLALAFAAFVASAAGDDVPIEANSICPRLGQDQAIAACPHNTLEEIKHDLEAKGYVLVPGPTMRSLLQEYGAVEHDLEMLESGQVHETLPRDPHPVMSHRQYGVHRMLMDSFDKIDPANTHACLQILTNEVASSTKEGSKINFKRDGTRYFAMGPDVYTRGSIPMALAKINWELAPKVHHPMANLDIKHNVTINDQLLVRITRDPDLDEAYSPTPEGRHQDSTEITSVVLVGLRNRGTGGETRLWTLDAPTGNYDEADFQSGKLDDQLLLSHVLKDPWETIYFNDRKLKHETRAFTSSDAVMAARRDVIINFIRKPLLDGTDVKLVRDKLVPV